MRRPILQALIDEVCGMIWDWRNARKRRRRKAHLALELVGGPCDGHVVYTELAGIIAVDTFGEKQLYERDDTDTFADYPRAFYCGPCMVGRDENGELVIWAPGH